MSIHRASMISMLRLGLASMALVLIVMWALTGATAQAAVMTFSGIAGGCPGFPNDPYTEGAITARGLGGGLSSWDRPGSAHLDPSGSACPSGIEFATGGLFDAVSADIQPADVSGLPSANCAEDGEMCGDPYENVLWQGFHDGVVVASDKLWMGDAASTYVFGEAFRGLDKLLVQVLQPNLAAIGGWCWDNPCSHFDLDNVTLALMPAIVPLPAALWLFVSALAGLASLAVRPGHADHMARVRS